jgi:hypothetical protein
MFSHEKIKVLLEVKVYLEEIKVLQGKHKGFIKK